MIHMINFQKLWKTMGQKNITTYQLKEKSSVDSKTIRRLEAIAEYIPE